MCSQGILATLIKGLAKALLEHTIARSCLSDNGTNSFPSPFRRPEVR